jgi:hypothetical protein
VPQHTYFGRKKVLGNTQKRLIGGNWKTGLGAKWAQSGHIEEKWDFYGILKLFKTAVSR